MLAAGQRHRFFLLGLASGTLFVMMAAHALLETARDALLLGALSPVALLWCYAAIAGVAVVSARLHRDRPLPLALVLAGAAVTTSIFWLVLPRTMPGGALVFYVYTALVATLIVPRFWLLLASRFTVGEAKRFYGVVGVGGVAGAGAGSALATFLTARLSVLGLLVAGAAVYLVAAVAARMLERSTSSARSRHRCEARSSEPKAYVRRLTLVALLASATVTIVDYLFKSVVAATVPANELGAYFARFYTAINGVALVVQLFLVPRVIRHFGTHAAAMLLPLFLLAGSGAFVFAAAPMLVLAARGADGALRNSLHRVTMELFYFPLPDDARNRWKLRADAVGQRGGQAAAAGAMLALLAAGAEPQGIAVLAATLGAAWLALVQSLRKPYVELFRASLRRGSLPVNVPPLGASTLQAILEALSSPDDAVTCAAIDFLALHGNIHLMPAAMVHHPSRTVALRALGHLVASGRRDASAIIEQLTTHGDPTIRVSALRARMQGGARDEDLVEALADSSFDVRATAMVRLLLRPDHHARARALIGEIVLGDSVTAKLALARAPASPSDRSPVVTDMLIRLLQTPSPDLRSEVLRAMARVPDPVYLPSLLPLLGERRLLPDARRAILASALGDSTVVEGWLFDGSLPSSVRRHLPRTLSAFGSERAAAALLARYREEPDSAVRYKILRGLGRMRADHPALRIDRGRLAEMARENLERAVDLLAWRVALAPRDGSATPCALEPILLELLKEKEERALERVFRVLDILHPEAELERVWRGVHSQDPRSRDVSFELIDQLDRDERVRLTALLERRADAVRLRSTGRRAPARETALRELSSDRSKALCEIARALVSSEEARRRVVAA